MMDHLPDDREAMGHDSQENESLKNWLIRTHKNHILGPVSKQKIIDLIEKGKLTEEDEVSSGNGYWFWIREKELLNKYVYGDTPQPFNPADNTPSVLTFEEKVTEAVYPDEKNLEFPQETLENQKKK